MGIMSSLNIQWIMNAAARAMDRWREEEDLRLAKMEFVKRTVNPVKNLWWKFMPGTTIRVDWPTGWTDPAPAPGGGFNQMESADPNDHFRPALEKLVGRQGWDWDWRLGEITGAQSSANGPIILSGDYLDIKFRRGREKYATLFLMRQK